MWNPDAVLRVEDIAHAPITVDRVDKAAAVQLVFEDALFHIVQHLIRTTRSTRLVMTGGTALNCVANMRLLEQFDARWYERNLGMKDASLHLWVPPIPGDAGVAIGAAYHFACLAGAKPGESLQHAFYCGMPPSRGEIEEAIAKTPEIAHRRLGNIAANGECERLADLVAFIVANDGIVGILPGRRRDRSARARPSLHSRESGESEDAGNAQPTRQVPRADPAARADGDPRGGEAVVQLCRRAPSDDDFNAYNYMVLTSRAKPEAYATIPAVIHFDGTCRVQIVREEVDPFVHAYLRAMGRRIGAEVSVNTSLNVGAPIAQTPVHALETLKRSAGMHALFMIAESGDLFVAWHDVERGHKDGGKALRAWMDAWGSESRGHGRLGPAAWAPTCLVTESAQRLDVPLVDRGGIGKRGDGAIDAGFAQQVQRRVRRAVGAVRDVVGGTAGEFVGRVEARNLHVAFLPDIPDHGIRLLQEEGKVDEIDHRLRMDQQRGVDLFRIRLSPTARVRAAAPRATHPPSSPR